MRRDKKNASSRAKAAQGQMDLFACDQPKAAGADPNPNESPQRHDRKKPKEKSDRIREQDATEPVDALVGTKEAARKLGIGVSTLEKMRAQRRGPPFVRLGKNIVRYRLTDLEAWITRLTL